MVRQLNDDLDFSFDESKISDELDSFLEDEDKDFEAANAEAKKLTEAEKRKERRKKAAELAAKSRNSSGADVETTSSVTSPKSEAGSAVKPSPAAKRRRNTNVVHPKTTEINIPMIEACQKVITDHDFPEHVYEKCKLYAYLIFCYVQSRKQDRHMNWEMFNCEKFRSVVPDISEFYVSGGRGAAAAAHAAALKKEEEVKEESSLEASSKEEENLSVEDQEKLELEKKEENRLAAVKRLNPNTIIKYILKQKTLQQIEAENQSEEGRGSYTCDVDENFKVHFIESSRGKEYQARRFLIEAWYDYMCLEENIENFMIDFTQFDKVKIIKPFTPRVRTVVSKEPLGEASNV